MFATSCRSLVSGFCITELVVVARVWIDSTTTLVLERHLHLVCSESGDKVTGEQRSVIGNHD